MNMQGTIQWNKVDSKSMFPNGVGGWLVVPENQQLSREVQWRGQLQAMTPSVETT